PSGQPYSLANRVLTVPWGVAEASAAAALDARRASRSLVGIAPRLCTNVRPCGSRSVVHGRSLGRRSHRLLRAHRLLEALLLGAQLDAHVVGLHELPAEEPGRQRQAKADRAEDDVPGRAGLGLVPAANREDRADPERDERRAVQPGVEQ